MLKIAHRINTIEQLKATSPELGVEVDIHAYGEELTVTHDAFVAGVSFERWLDAFDHSLVILNVKEEGIEMRVRELVLERGIGDFFFLDLTFPMLVKMVANGESRCAVRVSDYESIRTPLAFEKKVDWIWLDAFRPGLPLDFAECDELRRSGFRICLVSPELHGRSVDEIRSLRHAIDRQGICIDAVCTKAPDKW